MTTGSLTLLEILTDGFQIVVEPSGVFLACLAYLFNDRIVHGMPPNNSSGEHISGHTKP